MDKKVNENKEAQRVINAIKSKQEKHTVKYVDAQGHHKSRQITVNDPGAMYGLHMIDMLENGNDTTDYIGIYDLVMKNVIVSPKMSFDRQDRDLPKSLRTCSFTATNADGKKVTIHMKFPDTRTAIGMIRVMARPSGASNLVGTLKSLDANVFRGENGRAISADYWNAGHTGHGLAIHAINSASEYLARALDFNGFSSAVEDGISFLMHTVRA